MPLQSQLFRGDAKLEAAAMSDTAHIVPGATGEHVRKIQLALIQLDGATIALDGIYGPATAAAVLAYKQKRNIINRSYQTKADNIVGKMTMASLDQEMLDIEKRRQSADSVHCDFGVKRPLSILSSPFLLASLGSSPTPSPRAEALAHKQDAINWIVAAKNYLQTARSLMPPALAPELNKLMKMDEWAALATHFKFDKHNDPLRFISALGLVYAKLHIILAKAETYFVDDLANTKDFAYAPLGGYGKDLRISFCPSYCGKGPLFQTAVIVHESAHFADERIDHFASELPKMDGSPVNGLHTISTVNYAQMTPDQASRNAYSYAQFALHAFKKMDYRITPYNE